nr:putative E3 ubiquitin-protein ligase RF4 [Ipomoea trifida]
MKAAKAVEEAQAAIARVEREIEEAKEAEAKVAETLARLMSTSFLFYTEEQGYMEITTNVVNDALALLAYNKNFHVSTRPLFDGLEILIGYVLLEMVSVLKETKRVIAEKTTSAGTTV